jgi:hypothetical protein
MRGREHRTDAREARGRAGLYGGGAAEEDEPRAVPLGGRDGGERVAAPEPRVVLAHALPPLHLPVRRRRHHPRVLPRRPHPSPPRKTLAQVSEAAAAGSSRSLGSGRWGVKR